MKLSQGPSLNHSIHSSCECDVWGVSGGPAIGPYDAETPVSQTAMHLIVVFLVWLWSNQLDVCYIIWKGEGILESYAIARPVCF